MGVITGGKVIEGAISRSGAPSAEGANFGGLRTARADYDFSVDGGAVGTLGLIGSAAIPSGAVIVGGYVDVQTALTSGGSATVAIQVEAANDVVNAAAVSGAPWSTTGRKNVIPAFTGTASLKTTQARDISLVIATAALTAGKFTVYLFYVPASD
jgi:hypothetical protein